ncbi:hypothetical protein [Paractinoplanes lichenicola]|uniref:Uncharacterized protein n=1 Tax=Paractinoplanes lichenicola TaxID=2802976 RepID=A0ABS1VVM2_9ACTN|nr:hypothetical protein [Actinoplanes lichenicola]MBL7258529.1 hypothetical protein [Actinoplanes lichenicola]
MEFVRVQAVRWVDVEWPGWVEVRLQEAEGSVAVIVEKAPVLSDDDDFGPWTELPVPLEIACDVVGWEVADEGHRVATVRLGHGVEDSEGRGTFRVREDDVVTQPRAGDGDGDETLRRPDSH